MYTKAMNSVQYDCTYSVSIETLKYVSHIKQQEGDKHIKMFLSDVLYFLF